MYLWRARKIAWLVVGFVFSGVTVSDLAADVSVTGSLSSKSIIEGELLRFTLNVNNKTGTSLKNFRLLGPPDSYQFQQIYADSGQDSPHYYANARDFSQAKNVLFPAVPPGASYTAWGYLQSTTNHKAATLSMVTEWKPDASTSLPSSLAVSLGENEVKSCLRADWERFSGFTKIFAIPVVLALLPFLLSWKLKHRDDRAETLKQMLSQSLEYAAKYYLPVSAASQRLRGALSDQPNPPNEPLAFYYVIYMEKRMDEQKKAVGGFYFKDQPAERLASKCWKEYAEAIFGRNSQDDFNRGIQACVNKLKSRENYDAFAKRLEMKPDKTFQNADAQRAWEAFQIKLNDADLLAAILLNLNTFEAIVDFEVNRPFENWYGAQPEFIVTQEVKTRLKQLATQLGFTLEERKFVDGAKIG